MLPSQRTEKAPRRECLCSFLWILAFQFASFFLIKLFKVYKFREWQSTVTEVGDRLVNKPWKHKINWPSHPRQQFYLLVSKILHTFPKPKGSTTLLELSMAKNFVVSFSQRVHTQFKLPPFFTVKWKNFLNKFFYYLWSYLPQHLL